MQKIIAADRHALKPGCRALIQGTKKVKAIAVPAAAAVALSVLSSCTATSTESQENAAKVYDTICIAEPAVYAIASNLADSHGWSASKIQKLDQAHVVVVRLCSDRPSNLISGLVTLSAAYRDVLLLKAGTEA